MNSVVFIVAFLLGISITSRAQTCPITPERQELDFSAVATSCSDAKSICNSCTCALVDVYRPALVAGGVTFDPQNPSSFPLEKTADIIRACSEQYIVSMLMANINVTALAELSSCSYTADNVPSCLAPAVLAIANGNATVTASSRETETTGSAVPTASVGLRIATVQKQGEVVQMTLAGQLSSAAQLIQTMAASQELLAALPPAAAQLLQTFMVNAAAIDQNPNTPNILAALANPIDAVALINRMNELVATSPAAASPATPTPAAAAAPVPAPAPTSGALSASPLLAVVASVLLVAVLL